MSDAWLQQIRSHIERHIGRIDRVFAGDRAQGTADVIHVRPINSRPYHTLVTAGMSSIAMPVPPDVDAPHFLRFLDQRAHCIVGVCAHVRADAREHSFDIAATGVQLRCVFLHAERQLGMTHRSREIVRQLRELPFRVVQLLQFRLVHRLHAVESAGVVEVGQCIINSSRCGALTSGGTGIATVLMPAVISV